MKFTTALRSDKDILDNLSVSFEDGFEIITMYGRPLSTQTTNLYPTPPSNLPYAVTPNIPTYTPNNSITSGVMKEKSSHPLDGIPFKLSPALEMSTRVDADPVLEDVKNTISRVGRLLYSNEFEYDCSLEKDVLRD